MYEEKYQFHRKIRFLLILPIIVISNLILSAIVIKTIFRGQNLDTNTYAYITFGIVFMLLLVFFLRIVYKRYKRLKYSKLFLKNPKRSILVLKLENLFLFIIVFSFILALLLDVIFSINTIMGLATGVFLGQYIAAPFFVALIICYAFNAK